jgi:cyclopropane fatty-acyl-phospholipid synthase-like methyltransferase
MQAAADKVVSLYERHAQEWVAARLHQQRFAEQAWMDKFCGLVHSGGRVLDIGCGAGAPMASYLAQRGYEITGVDSSPAMIGLFRERLPQQQALVADMRTLSLNRSFDGMLAWDSLFHLSHDDQRRMFKVFRAHAATGCALMFSSGPEHGEAIGELHGEPLYHASLAPSEYRQLLSLHGFDVAATVSEDPHCGGRTVWLARLTSAP